MSQSCSPTLQRLIARHKRWDKVFVCVAWIGLSFAMVMLLALLLNLAIAGVPRLSWEFFTSFPSRFADKAGILSAWVGTLVVMLVTIVVSVPFGIAAAIYLEEYAPRNKLTTLIDVNIANLAGVPSIVYGLMALGLFVYQFHLGQSVQTAGLTLALLILPVIIITTREALRTVLLAMREAAYALGATKWQVMWDHVLPSSLGGIMTGVIIALSRAIGETAPLLTIGALTFIAFLPHAPVTAQPPFVSTEWLRDPFTVLPIQMFNWVSRPQEAFHQNAAAAGVVLVALSLGINGIAIAVRAHFRKRIRW